MENSMFSKPQNIQSGDDSVNVQVSGTGNKIVIGIPFEKYSQDLESKETKIQSLLVNQALSDKDKEILELKLSAIQQKRQNENASYEAYIADLESRIKRLDKLSCQLPGGLLEKAKLALSEGSRLEAEDAFNQIKNQANPHIEAAAEAEYQQGKLAEDDVEYHTACKYYQRAIELAPENWSYLKSYGDINSQLADYTNAIKYFDLALASSIKNESENGLSVIDIRICLSWAWSSIGETDKAIDYANLALSSSIKNLGRYHPEVASSRNILGLLWSNKGCYDKAIEFFQVALTSNLKAFDEAHPEVAKIRNNLGIAWSSKAKYDKAIKYFELALASNIANFGDQHPATSLIYNNLGWQWFQKGNLDKAIDYYQLALASNIKNFGGRHPKVASNYNNLALAMEDKGNVDKAIDYNEQALDINLQVFNDYHPDIATNRKN